jgi:hypothetical protein
MNWFDKLAGLLPAPQLTRGRIAFALVVAMIADGLQVLMGPLGWFVFDEIVDVVSMLLICPAIGFHLLLLPTFLVELLPIVDMLPTWTGCVIAVVALRKRGPSGATPTSGHLPPVIDVEDVKPPRPAEPPPPA